MRKNLGEGGDNGELTLEQKKKIINELLHREQPTISDFEGAPGYSSWMLEEDEREVERITASFGNKDEAGLNNAANDGYGRDAEAVITYVFNDMIFPTRGASYAFLASEYDDVKNQTDVVLRVNDKGNVKKFYTYAIQIATTTDPKKTREKFDRSANDKGSPAMTKYVKYCKRGDMRWKAPESPHFIVGMMPSRIDDAVEKFRFQNGELVGRESDPVTNFKVLSEMHEQIRMQVSHLRSSSGDATERLAKLDSLSGAVKNGLYRILGIYQLPQEKWVETFNEKYPDLVDKMRYDSVYNNIINEARRRTIRFRGGDALAATKT